MLILTRRAGESICIGPDIEISVLEISGDHVRLGIAAPSNVTVLRKELLQEVKEENLRAATSRGRRPLRPLDPLSLPTMRRSEG